MTTFGFNFLDEYKYEYVRDYQKWANMNTNMIIWTDICKNKYKYEYYRTKQKLRFYRYESYKSMTMNALMCKKKIQNFCFKVIT